jgi:hypothetical protein
VEIQASGVAVDSGKYSVALLITGEGYLGSFAAMGKQRFF